MVRTTTGKVVLVKGSVVLLVPQENQLDEGVIEGPLQRANMPEAFRRHPAANDPEPSGGRPWAQETLR